MNTGMERSHVVNRRWFSFAVIIALAVAALAVFLVPVIRDAFYPRPWPAAPPERTLQYFHILMQELDRVFPEKLPESFFRANQVNAGAKALSRITDLFGPTLAEHPIEEFAQDRDGTRMVVDRYDNPIIFIPRSLYNQVFVYRNSKGETFEVKPLKERLGLNYQMWLMGPNGVDDRGRGDDVIYSLSREQAIQGIEPAP